MSHESRLLFGILIGGLVTAQILNTWYNGSIFEKPRQWAAKYLPELLADLVACPLCFSHWVAGFGSYASAALFGLENTPVNVFSFAAYWLSVVCVANLVYYKAFHYEEEIDPLTQQG